MAVVHEVVHGRGSRGTLEPMENLKYLPSVL